MKHSVQHALIASALALAALAASAATPDQPAPGTLAAQDNPTPPRPDCAAGRLTALKTRLQLTPAQEGAWNDFVQAQRPQHPPVRIVRAELQALPTPQRLERLREWRHARDAEFERRSAATLRFYAALTPAQQAVFDAQTHHAGRPRRGPWAR